LHRFALNRWRDDGFDADDELAGLQRNDQMSHDNDGRPALSPTALSIEDAARLLSRVSGSALTPEMIQSDIAAGAPTNPDGTLNLIHFAAWLAKEAGRGD
jgi:hypothetical protein